MPSPVTTIISITLVAGLIDAVPPQACNMKFRWEDCGRPPKPVFYYWKPGSRCEVGIWRGCRPNLNMFEDEYECVSTCIFATRAQPADFHQNTIEQININTDDEDEATQELDTTDDRNEINPDDEAELDSNATLPSDPSQPESKPDDPKAETGEPESKPDDGNSKPDDTPTEPPKSESNNDNSETPTIPTPDTPPATGGVPGTPPATGGVPGTPTATATT